MAIFKITKDGVEEITTQDSSAYTYTPDGKTKSYAVQRVMYKHNHWMPPALVRLKGKQYLMPNWTEVHPKAQLSDVMWKRPERKVQKPDVTTKKFTSKAILILLTLQRKQCCLLGRCSIAAIVQVCGVLNHVSVSI